MTQQPDTTIKAKMYSLLITSLAMSIIGAFLVIFNLVYFHSGGSIGTGADMVIVLGVVGYLLTIIGPILTIVRFKWLLSGALSSPISSGTKTLSIVSFAIGTLLGILHVIIARSELRSGGVMYLIPAVVLVIYAEVVRRSILVPIQIQNTSPSNQEKRKTEQTGISEHQPVNTPLSVTTCPNCKQTVLPKSDGTCPSCQYKLG